MIKQGKWLFFCSFCFCRGREYVDCWCV